MMRDMGNKMTAYMSMGIPEYWVVNFNTGTIIRYVQAEHEILYHYRPDAMKIPVFEIPLRMSKIWKAVQKKGLLKGLIGYQDPMKGIDRNGKTSAEIRKELEFKAVLAYLTKANLISMEEAAEAENLTLEEYNNIRTII